ncbi:hypothetical protein E1B28_001607 [Marasmius oreades]|uniref:Prenylcysteine lyase domain-containing protein n=1 Tax=Marasmius oreades TaxID=181124 RepID=A0A9P8AFU8_9AGAR|nr:uncharacterized protein E1B28_001607 [Marasmius oreades]KAG7099795.1 hypothetical protein E1B28_001607 [Marasmius oreades]
MRSALFLSLASVSLAFQLPFTVPFFKSTKTIPRDDSVPEHGTPRIAIIGAGAGGSSAAFWIAKAKERFGVDVEIDVYEKESYVGGRSTTVQPYDDPSLPPVELGASIFVKANKNLWRATQDFNLTLKGFEDEYGDTGIWNGEKLLFTMGSSWWDTAKMFFRYGINAPRRTDSIVKSMIQDYLHLYSQDAPKWDNINTLATTLGFLDMTANTTANFFEAKGVAANFVREIIEAATRVNYGQNTDSIHALEGACSLATTGAAQVSEGNYQIFQRFLNYSQATVHLNTQVTRITSRPSSLGPWIVHSDQGSMAYKGIILAAPFHYTNIEFPPSIASQVPKQPYVHLHVTLLSTKSPSVNPEYLSLPLSSKVPPTLLTTFQNAREGGKAPEFNSLSYHGKIKEDERAVKIFSEERISDEWLKRVFNGQVGWVYRKEWDAYPKLPPTTVFPPVKLDTGFYYVNAFEPFISTMETETIASRNVVDLLLNEEFKSSICGPRISGSETRGEKTVDDEDFVYGWDC